MGWADEIHCKMFIYNLSEGLQLTLRKGIYQTKWRRCSSLKFNFEVVRPMQSRSKGAGFTEDVCKFMVVHWDTSHVNQSIVGGGLVGKKDW